MDPNRFDQVSRGLGRFATRRQGLAGLVAGVVSVLGWRQGPSVEAKPAAAQCGRNGERCGKKGERGNRGGPCKLCCSRYVTTAPNGKKRCTCRPDGMDCRNSSQCCDGTCTGGVCTDIAQLCIPETGSCPDGELECCVGLTCQAGTCLSPICSELGVPCQSGGQCCTGICEKDCVCRTGGEPCATDENCCAALSCSAGFCGAP